LPQSPRKTWVGNAPAAGSKWGKRGEEGPASLIKAAAIFNVWERGRAEKSLAQRGPKKKKETSDKMTSSKK